MAHCLDLNHRREVSFLRFAYPSEEEGRDRRSPQVRQHCSNPVQYYQSKDYCTSFVSLCNQIVRAGWHQPRIHHSLSDGHRGDLVSSFSCWSCGCLCHVGTTLGTMPAPCLAGRRYEVAVTQLDERQTSMGNLWRRPAAAWVDTDRSLQDSPGTAQGALGSTLDRHLCSQHTFFWAGRKACLLWSWIFSFFVLLGNK